MFNELYKKVVEKQLFNFFSEHNFNSYDVERIVAEVNKNKKLYGSCDLAQIVADAYNQKLAEAAPAAPAAGQQPAAAPAAGQQQQQQPQQPAAPAKPDPKLQQAVKKLTDDFGKQVATMFAQVKGLVGLK